MYVMTAELAEVERQAKELLRRLGVLRAAVNGPVSGTHPREHAALRRTSMDLTRALADYRKAGPYRWKGGSE